MTDRDVDDSTPALSSSPSSSPSTRLSTSHPTPASQNAAHFLQPLNFARGDKLPLSVNWSRAVADDQLGGFPGSSPSEVDREGSGISIFEPDSSTPWSWASAAERLFPAVAASPSTPPVTPSTAASTPSPYASTLAHVPSREFFEQDREAPTGWALEPDLSAFGIRVPDQPNRAVSHTRSASTESGGSSTDSQADAMAPLLDAPQFVLPEEWLPFVLRPQAEMADVCSQSGSLKQMRGGVRRRLGWMGEDARKECDDARERGDDVLVVKDLPAAWLPDVPLHETLPLVLFTPRLPDSCCEHCVKHGYVCASASTAKTIACYACETSGTACVAYFDGTEADPKDILQLAPLSSDEGVDAIGYALFRPAQDLRHRINLALRSRRGFGRWPRHPYGKGEGGYLVAYERSLAVFEELLRLKKERWVRLAWCDGKVLFFGDPSQVHEGTIGQLVRELDEQIIHCLEGLPPAHFALEEDVRQAMLEDAREIASGLLPANRARRRGRILFDVLFSQLLSTKVEGLDPLWVKLLNPVRQSPRLLEKPPTSHKLFVKEADILYINRCKMPEEVRNAIAIAAEVAFCNESLRVLKEESLLWKKLASLSLAWKIDPSGKPAGSLEDEEQEGEGTDEPIKIGTLDPRIAFFVVRNAVGPAELAAHPLGIVREQYALGRGSGTRLEESAMTDLRRACHGDAGLLALLDDVDSQGTVEPDRSSNYHRAFPGFRFVECSGLDRIQIPIEDLMLGALCAHSQASASLYPGAPVLAGADVEAYLTSCVLRLKPSDLRYNVIKALIDTSLESRPAEGGGPAPLLPPPINTARLRNIYFGH